MEEIEAFIKGIRKNPRVRKRFSVPEIQLVGDPEERWRDEFGAFARGTEIHVPVDGANRPVAVRGLMILHEVAHVLAGTRFGVLALHGLDFTRTHMDLVEIVLGYQEAESLEDAYQELEVEVAPRWWHVPPTRSSRTGGHRSSNGAMAS
jgi:putative metallohydrolase (TIGR04338 family)